MDWPTQTYNYLSRNGFSSPELTQDIRLYFESVERVRTVFQVLR